MAATEGFERAGAMRHSADSEMGLVRAAMQTGQYRRALAFCAHVAGEHLDAPGAAVLYAWLLRVGGRADLADRVLREALERAPDDPVLEAGARALAAPWPVADSTLEARPHRVAPFATGVVGERPPPLDAAVWSSGVLLPGGARALVPGRPPSTRLWLRDGLGRTREAVATESGSDGDRGTSLCLLTNAFGDDDVVALGRRPFAGMPVFAALHSQAATSAPAWPWLRAGFLGTRSGDGEGFRLGIDLVGARAGGPVLDRTGRVVGSVVRDAEGRATLQPIGRITGAVSEDGSDRNTTRPADAAGDLAFDELYERALRITLQVIVA